MAPKKVFKKIRRKILHSKLVTFIIVQIIYWYIKFIRHSCSWEIRGLDKLEKEWAKNQNFITLCWHSRALMMPVFWNHKFPIDALVSPHNDGRLIAWLVKKFGAGCIDGSSNDNAVGAAVAIIHSLQNKRSIVITPDGPRGPRMKLKPSALYFAQKSGCPIIAATYSIKGAKTIKRSWDNMLVPKPFSEGIVIASDPIYIPKETSEKEFEEYRLKVEKIMTDVQNQADDEMGVERTKPATEAKTKRRR